MLLFYFRLSLKPSDSPDGFGGLDSSGRPFSRETWLRHFFSTTRYFQHRNQTFAFVKPDIPVALPSKYIVGYIARPRLVSGRTAPDAGFQPAELESWRGALIVIDPTDHQDGQKIAIEFRPDIGKPQPVLWSLAKAMRIDPDPPPFDAQVHPIVEAQSFWHFAEENNFEINLLSFDVAPPNMFNGRDEFSQELRQLRERNRVNRMKATLTSDTTIDVEQSNIREIVDYTELGAGSVKARAVSGKKYNSRDHVTKDRIDTEQEKDDFWSKVARWLGERF